MAQKIQQEPHCCPQRIVPRVSKITLPKLTWSLKRTPCRLPTSRKGGICWMMIKIPIPKLATMKKNSRLLFLSTYRNPKQFPQRTSKSNSKREDARIFAAVILGLLVLVPLHKGALMFRHLHFAQTFQAPQLSILWLNPQPSTLNPKPQPLNTKP